MLRIERVGVECHRTLVNNERIDFPDKGLIAYSINFPANSGEPHFKPKAD
jgi:hypothetical protein